jgi:hypothetical protein
MLEPGLQAGNVDAGRAGIASVLLTLQAGFGLVSALGLLVFARISGSLASVTGQALFALLIPLLTFVAAGGVIAYRSWARRGALALETVTLIFALLRLLISHGETLALAPLLTTFTLPVTVLALLLGLGGRRLFAAQRQQAR